MNRALDATDKESFAEWLDALSNTVADANDAAIDAVRPRRKRTLSRGELGRRFTDAHDRIAALLDAARRGLGPTLRPALDTDEPTEPPSAPPDRGVTLETIAHVAAALDTTVRELFKPRPRRRLGVAGAELIYSPH